MNLPRHQTTIILGRSIVLVLSLGCIHLCIALWARAGKLDEYLFTCNPLISLDCISIQALPKLLPLPQLREAGLEHCVCSNEPGTEP